MEISLSLSAMLMIGIWLGIFCFAIDASATKIAKAIREGNRPYGRNI
jgi:hypothetical protein